MTGALDPGLTFGTLVVGGANQLAASAAAAVADAGQPPFNPLFIHGGPGLGKTHLLHAIGHRRREVEPRAVVVYTTWAEATEGWKAAQALGRAEDFLLPLREADLLLLDDTDRLAQPTPAQHALLGLLDARLAAQRFVVLAGRGSPADLLGSDDPASGVVGRGLVAELARPDAAMRWDILHRRGVEAGAELSPAVLQTVAALPCESIRDLVGAASRLIAFQTVTDVPLDPAQARVLVTGVLDEPAPDTGAPSVTARPPRPVGAAAPTEDNEFGSFLSDVVESVSRQVDAWRSRVADAMLRFQAEGYHVARLQALLDQELPAQPDVVLRRFERDVDTLRRLEADVGQAAPDLAAHEAFRDPDQVAVAEELAEQARTRDLASRLPLRHFRFDDLVEATSNHHALESARAVVASPGAGSTPLLVVGESGVGKTHLLHAIGNALVDAGVRGVACLTAQELQGEVKQALDADRLAEWRRGLRWAGALLLDDVQYFAGDPATQEEVCSLVDRLLERQRQVVATSAVPLAELSLVPQLLTRLASGLVIELPRPDREVRLGVVRRLLAATAAGTDPALADYLASRPAESVRAVHAQVQRILRAAETGDAEPSFALARQVLEAPPARPVRVPAARPGHLGPTVGGPRLREKLVDAWPSPGDRLIEGWR